MDRVIGLDIGATKIEGVLLLGSEVLKYSRKLTEAHKSRSKILENICHSITELYSSQVKAIGIGIPGRINKKGEITYMPNIKSLVGFNMKNFLQKKFKIQIVIENDAVCFAVAEHVKGAANGFDNMVGITIGTGIGSGIILNNRIHRGKDNAAGEIGHNLMAVNNKLEEFENLASGHSIVRQYVESKKSGFAIPEDILKDNDKVSRTIAANIYKYLALSLANLINTLNPDIIVLGGSVSNSIDYKLLNKQTSRLVIPLLQKSVNIVKHKLGESSGMHGAAYLALRSIHISKS